MCWETRGRTDEGCKSRHSPSGDYQSIVIPFRHDVEMLCPLVSEWRDDVLVGVMESETAFLTNSFRLGVPVIISAPNRVEHQVFEAS